MFLARKPTRRTSNKSNHKCASGSTNTRADGPNDGKKKPEKSTCATQGSSA